MITIIDYGVGNLGSIANMFKKIGVKTIITADANTIAQADKLILPGVGAFDNGMRNLQARGLVEVLNSQVLEKGVPILGLCVGLQLFTRKSEEGQLPGLGWLDAAVVRFKFDAAQHVAAQGIAAQSAQAGLKIPHMGWNYIQMQQASPLLTGLPAETRFYFVHSYHLVCTDASDVLAQTTYGYAFPSIVQRGNIYGAQFHPEKSHRFGMQFLKNFAEQVAC
jgi:imidazole glycerol-phosphate synthase subunit HisH